MGWGKRRVSVFLHLHPRPPLLQEKGKHLKTSKPIDFQFILTRTYLRRARVVDARETNKVLVYQSGSLLKSSVSISYEAGSAPEWPIQKEAFRSSGLQLLFIIFTDVKLMWCRLLYYSLTSCAVTDAEDVFYRYIKSNALSRRFRLIKFYWPYTLKVRPNLYISICMFICTYVEAGNDVQIENRNVKKTLVLNQ